MKYAVMTHPGWFEVSYHINPWMRPDRWRASSAKLQSTAQRGWWQLRKQLREQGVQVSEIDSVPGMPDLVFPANAAVVLDGRALLSRFANAERRIEEPVHLDFMNALWRRGQVQEVARLPVGVIQEGAGDCLWDPHRHMFWAGFGQRSERVGTEVIADYFSCAVQPLELADPRFYHLDVALAVLAHGDLLYYPAAFSPDARAAIRERVPAEQLLEVTHEEAERFNVNIVSVDEHLFLTPASDRLRAVLQERGYRLHEIDLSPFLLAGGAAACLTLRLDHARTAGSNLAEVSHHA